MSKNMKEIQFDTVSYDSWKEHAITALKGKPFESLFTKTIEGLTLEPLYTQEKLFEKLGEQLDKQVSTIRSLREDTTFKVAQQVYAASSEEFLHDLKESLARGNEVVTVDSRVVFDWDKETLQQLAQYFTEYSFKLTVQGPDDALLSVFDFVQHKEITGLVLSPVAVTVDFPNVRTIAADTLPFHNKGANAIQELALALALAAKYADEAQSFETFASKFFVTFGIDTQFFTEIAKLRAFKVLWKAFMSAYGVTEDFIVPTVAETSVRSYSKLDVYVNLLRGGNEALSGAIGGAEYFTVHPHDVLTKPTGQSVRIARNVSLILKEETHVMRVTDPAGGSYFIESLTADFVKEAWALFLTIQSKGGFDAFKASGELQAMLDETYQQRTKAIETRKTSLIGTNIYANPADELPTDTNPVFEDVLRLALPFETLRAAYVAAQPKVAILTYGELKDFKPRADFVAGVVNTVGVIASQSGALQTVEEAQAWLKQTDANYVVIAATNDNTEMLVPQLVEVKPAGMQLDVAGKFAQLADWQQAGLDGAVFAGQNIIEKLHTVLQGMKEVQQ